MTEIFISLTIITIGLMFIYKFKGVINNTEKIYNDKIEENEDFVYV